MSQLDDIVKWGGALVSAAVALRIALRPRTGSEPEPSGISKFAYSLAVVVVAAILATIVYDEGATLGFVSLAQMLKFGLIGSVVGVALYAWLSSLVVYETVEIEEKKPVTRRIIGGFWLTPYAKTQERDGKTVQAILLGANYDLDRVWPRSSQGLATLLVISSYVLLMVGLSTSLAVGAVLIGRAAGPAAPEAVNAQAGQASPPAPDHVANRAAEAP